MAMIDREGNPLFSESMLDNLELAEVAEGCHRAHFELDATFLKMDQYYITLHLVDMKTGEVIAECGGIPAPEVIDDQADPVLESHRWGHLRIPTRWSGWTAIPADDRAVEGLQ
jgi:hypothetical protein